VRRSKLARLVEVHQEMSEYIRVPQSVIEELSHYKKNAQRPSLVKLHPSSLP